MGKIKVIVDDITTLYVDAIVNAANNSLLGGGGVDGAIHRAAGRELYNECLTLNGSKTGEAKITKGYNLHSKYVVHTVGPIYNRRADDPILLERCYRSSMDLAKANDVHTIAFPCISTGVYGYPKELATPIAIDTVKKWMEENSEYQIDVTFCCFSWDAAEIYQKILGL